MRIAWNLIWGRFLMAVNPVNKDSLRKASRANREILSLSISWSPPYYFIKKASRVTSAPGRELGIEEKKKRGAALNTPGLGRFAPSLIMSRCGNFRYYTSGRYS
jgi:hypothetical protein